MQALTGLFARQFGTPNYAAHGGFCSVNMAAGMIYTIGGSFWEFGGPDLERAKVFVMIGTAEDHHSNPLKIAISKFKRRGGRFISVNPVRTGYSAIADEWVPIRPGTDGALLLAIAHELIDTGLYDRRFLARYTNAGYLIDVDPDSPQFGIPVRTGEDTGHGSPHFSHDELWWDRISNAPVLNHTRGADPYLAGEFRLPDGKAGEACVPAPDRARARLHAGMGGGHHRCTRRHDSQTGARAGRHGARRDDRAADSVDRQLGRASRDRDRQSGRLSCDARSRCAFEWFSDHPGARDRDDDARHDRSAGRLPAQGAVSARHSADRARTAQRKGRAARQAARRATARLAERPGRALRGRARPAGADRQGVLVGAPACRARDDAQRHHECLARRSLSHRHAFHLHGEHGVELDHEHARRAQDAERSRRERRISHPVPHRLRRVRVRDDGVRRSRAARHDLSRAARRDVDARSADLGVRRADAIRCAFRFSRPKASASRFRTCWSSSGRA